MKLKNIKADFTLVPNTWFKAKLSFKALGLLAFLQSLPDDWEFSIAGVVAITGNKRSTVQSALRELEEAGLVARRQTVENGRFSHSVIELRMEKNDEKTVGGKIDNGKVDGGKKTTTNIYIQKNNIQNKKRECAPEALRLSDILHEKILQNKPTRNISPNWRETWAMEIEKIHRIDGREWKRIYQVLVWSQQDSFWWKNILSGQTLRAKFDRLEDDMEAIKNKENKIVYLS